MLLRRAVNAPKGIRTPSGAELSVSVALCGSGEIGAITRAPALTADASGEPTWIQLCLQGHLGWSATGWSPWHLPAWCWGGDQAIVAEVNSIVPEPLSSMQSTYRRG